MTIAESLAESTRLQLELDKERDVFYPLAEAGSRVYFALTDLVKINWMYQFSLNSFLHLFQKALEAPRDSALNVPDRMAFLQKRLEALTYAHVSQALFKTDRLMFTVHLTRCLRPEAITDEEWQFFIGLTGLDTSVDSALASHWVGPERIREVIRLKVALPKLYASLRLDDCRVWADWMRNTQTDDFQTPIGLQANPPTDFQLNVLTVQTIRPDRLHTALRQFANRCLGLPHLGSPTLNLYRLYETETRATEPILLLISPGADPSQELAEAAAMRFSGKSGTTPDTCSSYRQVAMGQGQADLALRELHEAAEAPPGLKRNLRRTYESWTRPYLAQGNSSTRATALFTLAWFHAVVQERRSYIPQGWTKFYEFSYADLRVAADIIDRLLLDTSSKGPVKDVWSWIHGLFADAIYGGRMDNDFDSEVLRSYLVHMFSDDTVQNLRLGPLRLPGTTELRDYTTLIETLPDYDPPEHFNLPANIDRSAQRNAANRVIAQLRLLSRSTGKTNKFDKAVWSQELGPILVLWKKLNQGLQLIQHRSSATCEGLLKSADKPRTDLGAEQSRGDSVPFSVCSESPVVEFLRLELRNALHLIHTVHTGLAGLSRACRGMQFVTAALHRLAESLLHGETPSCWLSEWPEGPEEPISFLRDLVTKANAVQNWMTLAEANQLIQPNSAALDLADLFRPSTFLNAVRQQTARQLGVSIDSLKLTSYWPDQSGQAPEYGSRYLPVRIAKLKLEGANFESGRLAPSQLDSPSLTHLPDVTLVWIEQGNRPAEAVIILNTYRLVLLKVFRNLILI
ncbi:dynein heavy chain 2, cytosolic [Paragonimus westermani]|uniref:Dynein heavy chain 2, cytosolic n=1 Tax=Paragonimus westermani TaxID=34504 RepID=A0A5J4P0T1_9TREM|nr:dynein heavy chain 2, cytosolic [Paragonimus westermani]